MKTIYLVRHGQTYNNVTQRVGTPDDPLTELGTQQAALIADRLKQVGPIDAILCSTYERARQTVAPIASTLSLAVEYMDVLIESRRPKEIEGLLSTDPEMQRINGLVYQNWGNQDWHYSTEENFYDLSARARVVLDMLAARSEERLIVVSHGAFMKMLIELVLLGDALTPTLSTDMYMSLQLGNTGVTVIQCSDDGKWMLVRWNDTVHLEPETQSI